MLFLIATATAVVLVAVAMWRTPGRPGLLHGAAGAAVYVAVGLPWLLALSAGLVGVAPILSALPRALRLPVVIALYAGPPAAAAVVAVLVLERRRRRAAIE